MRDFLLGSLTTTGYESVHGEIFNPIEQARLHDSLRRATAEIGSGVAPPLALDYGCGSGNLTHHLVGLGLDVVAADVDDTLLRGVRRRFAGYPVTTLAVNGRDLASVPDASFDFVGTYSVLHHVPDYLAIVAELVRVLRPGGILYLDHEESDGYWAADGPYRAFLAQVPARPRRRRRAVDLLSPGRWVRFLRNRYRRLRDPRYSPEGDIHVWPDDRIEWDRVLATLERLGTEVVFSEDYLVYRPHYPVALYRRSRSSCADMRVLCARRRAEAAAAAG